MTKRTSDPSGISLGIEQVRGFFGWRIVGVSMFLLTLMSVTTFMGVGTYLVALETRFGWSRTALSGAFSLARVQGAIIGPMEGFLVDRFGNRTMIMIGFTTMGVGFLLVARVTELWHFYAAFFLVTIGSSLGGWLAVISMVNNWFVRHRSKAMATAMMGVHFGGFLVPVLALGIQSHGFSIAMTGIGAALLLTVIPVFKSLSNRPEDRGERPDGPDFGRERSSTKKDADGEVDFTPRQALRTRAFWILTVVHLSSTASIVSLSLHLSPKLVDLGMSLTGAATIVMWSTVFAMPAQMAAGFLADRLPKPPMLSVLLLIQAASLVIIALADSVTLAYPYAILYGIAIGGRIPLLTAIRGDYFGRRSFATIMGLSQMPTNLAMIVAPILTGYAYDVQGSYLVPFMAFAGLSAGGALLVTTVRRPKPPEPRPAARVARTGKGRLP